MVRQFQHYKSLLLFWLLLLGVISGFVGKGFGGAFLLLEPEYLGEERFWSLFIVGAALGAFLFAYMVTVYISESYRFHFLAFSRHPFFTFFYNNLLVPASFLVLYFIRFAVYHSSLHSWGSEEFWDKVLGLVLGIGAALVVFSGVFFSQRGLIQQYGDKLGRELSQHSGRHKRKILLGRAKEAMLARQDTTSYLTFPFRLMPVGNWDQMALRDIVRFLNQHHGKLLLWQILTFSLIALLGLMEDNRYFQIPAGASLLLFMSLGIMIIGALSFWFRRAGYVVFVALGCLFFVFGELDAFDERNRAFGMNYDAPPASYTVDRLAELTTDDLYRQDREATLQALNRWKRRYQQKYGYHTKPRAVFVTASGGGLRSAYWTFQTLQQLDSLTSGRLSDEIRLMSGASGGMFGQAYFRELYLRKRIGQIDSLQGAVYRENISRDLLNRLFFRMFTDVILPNGQVRFNGHTYDKEVGYSFDRQVAINLPELAGRRLGDYAEPERQGLVPQLILTPTIINQGRQLYISSSAVSYLSRPSYISPQYAGRARGVEFRRLFAAHDADSLLMTTALRMNASFPVLMPVVELPSEPLMEVMDAGAMDNYGTLTAVQYLSEFRNWFAANTEGVIFLQIRDNDRVDPIREGGNRSLVKRLTLPLGGGYNSIIEAKDMSADYLLEFVAEWYQGPVEVIPVEYPRETSKDPVSLSWHLTNREKHILSNVQTPVNEQALATLREIYQPGLYAERPQVRR
ncbi:MAG: hypothetical protein OHK0039_35900 [Bacteroidia bacterium]